MSIGIAVEISNPSVPLTVTLVKDGLVAGASPTVAVRDGSTLDSYLDWSDNTFKTAGWTLKYAPVAEVENGHYRRILNLSLISGLTQGKTLVAEFAVVDDSKTWVGHDVYLLINADTSTLLRKLATNRLEEAPGNPGLIVLYDDDSLTPLLSWEIRDALGGAVVSNVGAPARRKKAT